MARSSTKERQLTDSLQQQIQNNQSNLIGVVEQFNQILTTFNDRVQVVESQMAIATYGEEAIVDNDLGLVLARQLRFEGAGVNSSNITGWMKRFNGMSLTNQTGMISDLGMLIIGAEFSCDNNEANRTVQFRHYSENSTDGQIAGEVAIDRALNQFGKIDNAKIFIPGGRRFAYWLNGGSFRYPQIRIAYRKVLEVVS